MFEEIKELDGQIVVNQWIEWDHIGVPNYPKEYREICRAILSLTGHCVSCTALDGCYFIERNMPAYPLHNFCDCKKIKTSIYKVKRNAKAECPISKFTDYIFTDDIKSKGKKKIFELLGYGKSDSEILKKELENQALKEYLSGNYLLKNLDGNGQRVSIPVFLAGKGFYTGWILEPEGHIRNTTPFVGWVL